MIQILPRYLILPIKRNFNSYWSSEFNITHNLLTEHNLFQPVIWYIIWEHTRHTHFEDDTRCPTGWGGVGWACPQESQLHGRAAHGKELSKKHVQTLTKTCITYCIKLDQFINCC